MKKLAFRSLNDLKQYAPINCEDTHHVDIKKFGYLHDVGYDIILTPISNGEEPTGWDDLETHVEEIDLWIDDCWELCEHDFAYAFQKH